MKGPLKRWLETGPSLVVLPNDAAFPYDCITRLAKERGIPFVLVQEGIRFSLPVAEGDEYGRNGAAAIAAWGENSARFFEKQGVARDRIHVTGSPRHDEIVRRDWKQPAAVMKKDLKLGSRVLAFLTNPIDDQGFCTTERKMELVREFLVSIDSLFQDLEYAMIIKIHGRESQGEYVRVCRETKHADRIHVLQSVDLYTVLTVAKASIVFASTVGLESLLFDCSLGVLEIPEFGFAHDYVHTGAAIGLAWNGDMAREVRGLFEPRDQGKAQAYIDNNLAFMGEATQMVSNLILKQLSTQAQRV